MFDCVPLLIMGVFSILCLFSFVGQGNVLDFVYVFLLVKRIRQRMFFCLPSKCGQDVFDSVLCVFFCLLSE